MTHSREPVPITIRGTAYPSINAAARALKVTPRCVHKAIEAGTLDRVGVRKWGGKQHRNRTDRRLTWTMNS